MDLEMLTDEQPDDTSTIRHLRRRLREVTDEARDRREELEALRDAAIRGHAHAAGVSDPRHAAAVARLHPKDADVSTDAVRSTIEAYGDAFGVQPSGNRRDDDE